MRETVQPADLSFFSTLAASSSLSAAARELGLTAAAVSTRLTQMESRAGVALINRTTRRMMLTPEGELYVGHARRILDRIVQKMTNRRWTCNRAVKWRSRSRGFGV
jgi:LysR family transcriptional activator of dmlA